MAVNYAPRHVKTRDWAGIRLVVVGVLFGLAWLALWSRSFQVQVLMHEELSARADRQHQAAEFVSGQRGRIFDSRGRVLAKSVQCRSVFARPMDVEDRSRTARELGRVLGVSAGSVAKRLNRRRPFVWIERQVGDREAAAIQALDLPGVGLVEEYKRLYPNGHLAGQLLGFTGTDGQGLEGLELSLEPTLAAGRDKTLVQRDARGRRLYGEDGPTEASVSGADVALTIDADIQAMAEQAVERAVTAHKGKSGMGLVVHVPTGEILAWAQYPFFNPNIYGSYRPQTWRNRIALDALEPGSTMKPFVVAAALQDRVVDTDTEFYCEDGRFEMPGAVIRDTHDYADLPVSKILRYSSNIGMAKIGMQMGARELEGYLAQLGFGERPGLPLPGESKGIVRDPGTWREVDLANIAFGQGIAVTALQMARAYLCLARGGVLAPLVLVKDGAEPVPEKKVFSTEVAKKVLSMMRDVVEEDGTGRNARIEGMEVAGKTGTAQKPSDRGGYGEEHVASFVALLPAGKPEFLVLVMVDEPGPQHYGGVVAAPAVREIAVQSLAYLGRLPEPAVMTAQSAPVAGEEEAHVRTMVVGMHAGGGSLAAPVQAGASVPDVVGLSLRRAFEVFASGGAVPELRGHGVVIRRQSPAPGRPWPKPGQPCVLWLADAPKRS